MPRAEPSKNSLCKLRDYFCPSPPVICNSCCGLCAVPMNLAYAPGRGPKQLRPNALDSLVCIRCGAQAAHHAPDDTWMEEI